MNRKTEIENIEAGDKVKDKIYKPEKFNDKIPISDFIKKYVISQTKTYKTGFLRIANNNDKTKTIFIPYFNPTCFIKPIDKLHLQTYNTKTKVLTIVYRNLKFYRDVLKFASLNINGASPKLMRSQLISLKSFYYNKIKSTHNKDSKDNYLTEIDNIDMDIKEMEDIIKRGG